MAANGSISAANFQMFVDWGQTPDPAKGLGSFVFYGAPSTSPVFIPSLSPTYFAVNVDGFLISTQPNIEVLRTSFSLDALEARIDPSSYVTYLPVAYYDTIMKELLLSSVGYFYDTDFDMYVLNCAQRSLMKDLYIRF